MAEQKNIEFSQFLIKLGDGEETEAFSQPCGFNSRGIEYNNELGQTISYDCSDETSPEIIHRFIKSREISISGSGIVAMENWPVWRAFLMQNTAKNIQVHYNLLLANNGGYWQFPAFIEKYTSTGERDGESRYMTFDCTIKSSGKISESLWTPAAS